MLRGVADENEVVTFGFFDGPLEEMDRSQDGAGIVARPPESRSPALVASPSAPPASGQAATAPRERRACSIATRRLSEFGTAPGERRVEAIAALGRLRMTGAQIAWGLGMPEQTVSGILKVDRVGRLGRIGLEPACRYERSRPGELVHVDVWVPRPSISVRG